MAYRLIITIGFMAGIFALSSIPGRAGSRDSIIVRFVATVPSPVPKIMHVLLYAGLAWLWFWTLADLPVQLHYRALSAFLVTVAFGAFNEWHQLHVPGRYGSLADVILNSAGAALGLLAALRWTE